MPQSPDGRVTFLLSAVEDTEHLRRQSLDALASALRRHDQVLRSATEDSGGHVFNTVGVAFCAVFAGAKEAVQAAAAAQGALMAERWPEEATPRVRMALHTGECEERGGDYFGPALNRTACLEAAAQGGQILVSRATADLVRGQLPVGATLRDLGTRHLKDLDGPEEIYELELDGVARNFATLRLEVSPFDVFVSYRRSDSETVRLLVDSIKERGLRVWFDEASIPDFGGITDSVRQGLAESKAVLVFYSDEYPRSSPCQWELTSAFLASTRLGDPRRRMLVVNPEAGPDHIEPVELRDALYLSISGSDRAEVERIAGAVAGHVSRLHGALGAAIVTPALWLPAKPSAATRFVGRWREMWRIHSALHAPDAGLTQGVVGQGAVQVRGLGGIGKSLLAREYALRFGASYPGGVFWLYAQGDLAVESSRQERDALRLGQLRGFAASVLGTENATGLDALPPEDVEAVLRNALAGFESCLWVVDDLPEGLDADEVYRWLGPATSTSTLITTRSAEYQAIVAEVALSGLEPEEALKVMLARRTPTDEEELAAAKAVVSELGGHALAVDVAGATLRFQSFSELLDHLLDPTEDELELAAELREELPTGKERSISSTLSHSLDRLDEEGKDLLRLASMLARDPIPRKLFDAVFQKADDLTVAGARTRTMRALDQLLSLSLIEPTEKDSWQIHPLLARTVQFKDTDVARQASLRRSAEQTLKERLDDGLELPTRDAIRQLVGHARRLAQNLSTVERVELLSRVTRYDYEIGDYTTAKDGNQRQVATLSHLLGPHHPDTLKAMGNLAITIRDLGDLQAARGLEEEVLALRRDLLGPHHPDTLKAMGNLAITIRDLGDLQAARGLEEEVLALRRDLLGPHHPDTLEAMANLAITIKELGELQAARGLQEEVLDAFREILGQHHLDTLRAMHGLANTISDLGDLQTARGLQEEVLALRRDLLGPHHPDSLRTMNNLAITIKELGELQAARGLQEEVLDAFRDLLGAHHPNTLWAMNNLANTIRDLGDLQTARGLQEEVLDALRDLLGPDRPDTLRAMHNLAITIRQLGELQAARVLQEEVLDARREVQGPDHPDTLWAMRSLAITIRDLGELQAARGLQEEVLDAFREVLGPKHHYTVATMSDLAETLRLSGDLEGARSLGEEALPGCEEVHGPHHPLTLMAMSNLAATYKELGELQKARDLGREALAGLQEVLGPNHPDTNTTKDRVVATIDALGEADAARELDETTYSP